MRNRIRRMTAFRPSISESTLEYRLVLSSVAVVPPAAPPVASSIVIPSPRPWKTLGQLRANFARNAEVAMVELRSGIGREIQQLFANGTVPTSQQISDLNANVQGALDATALRLSSQAALLPGSAAGLVPAIQNSLLGSGSRSLSSVLSSALQSGRNTASAVTLQTAFARQFATAPRQIIADFNNFFGTHNVNQLAVNSTGQRVPLRQFMAGQVVSQLGNSLGSLDQSFPIVANAMLFPNGSTASPSQDLIEAFGQQSSNALDTAAMQLGSALSIFGGSSHVISQLGPMLFGSASNLNSLASSLQNLSFGSSGFNSAVDTAFNGGFSNLLSPINSFLGMQGQSSLSLPTTGLTSPFSSQFSTSSFASGFNNGFASDTNSGFTGFGAAPSAFNTNFGTGFNNTVTSVTQSMGFGATGFTGGGVPINL